MLRYIVVMRWFNYFASIHCLVPHWPPLGLGARRFFEKGVLRFVVLDLLTQKPAHGYEIIRSLKERSHGFYTPSPGSIYPTLQLLQDQGYLTSNESEGKKTYTITDSGRQYLAKHAEVLAGLRQFAETGHNHPLLNEQFHDAAVELRKLGQMLMRRAPSLSQDKINQVRDVVKKAAREIEGIIKP
jgi:DNA-binding PadR family transcriptional regulator